MPVKLDFAHSVFGSLVNRLIRYLSTPTRQPHIPKGKKKRAASWQAKSDLHNTVKGTIAGTFQSC